MTKYDLHFINQAARDLSGTIKLQLKWKSHEMNPTQHLSGIGHVLTRLTLQLVPKALNIQFNMTTYYNWK